MARTILLLDGDQYLHRGCAAVEKEVQWDEENYTISANSVEAWEVVIGSIDKVHNHFGKECDLVVCLSEGAPGGFRRKLVDPSYKMQRKDTRKPLCFYEMKEKLKLERKCVFFDDLEADDVMGILSTKPGPDHKIIISRDKDMKTIPGTLWDGGSGFHVINEGTADYWHLYQTLVGDASDGYKGCPGIGPVKAQKILKQANELAEDTEHPQGAWPAVVWTYIKAGLTEADALTQARLARILRWDDWDSQKKEVRLWTP
jgi:5'-3' exonuclease